jgi:hypothetical protein
MKYAFRIFLTALGLMLLLSTCGDKPSASKKDESDSVAQHLFGVPHVLSSADWKIPAGSTISTKETRSIINASIDANIRDQKISGLMTKEFKRAYVSDYISDTSIRTEFKKDEITGRAIVNGMPAPQPNETAPMHGQTIMFSKSDSGWQGILDGAEATPDQRSHIEELARQIAGFNNRVIFGRVPRELGDTWEIDPAKLNSYAGGLEEMNGTFKVFFRSLVKHQGYDCAEILTSFHLLGRELQGKEMQLIGKTVMLQSLDYQIPLRMEMKGEIMMSNPVMNGLGNMRTKGPIELIRETTFVLP